MSAPNYKDKTAKEYFAEYYEKNREAISKKRKAKYRNDTSYRENILLRQRLIYNQARKTNVNINGDQGITGTD